MEARLKRSKAVLRGRHPMHMSSKPVGPMRIITASVLRASVPILQTTREYQASQEAPVFAAGRHYARHPPPPSQSQSN